MHLESRVAVTHNNEQKECRTTRMVVSSASARSIVFIPIRILCLSDQLLCQRQEFPEQTCLVVAQIIPRSTTLMRAPRCGVSQWRLSVNIKGLTTPASPILTMILTSLVTLILGAAHVLAFPSRRTVSNGAVINQDFADPGLMRDSSGTWYAFSTSSSSGLVPMSKSTDFANWTSPRSVLNSIPWADG